MLWQWARCCVMQPVLPDWALQMWRADAGCAASWNWTACMTSPAMHMLRALVLGWLVLLLACLLDLLFSLLRDKTTGHSCSCFERTALHNRGTCSSAGPLRLTCADEMCCGGPGAFAEAVREQWLQERMEYFSELEATIYDAALGSDECDRAEVIFALMKVDVNLTEKQVC